MQKQRLLIFFTEHLIPWPNLTLLASLRSTNRAHGAWLCPMVLWLDMANFLRSSPISVATLAKRYCIVGMGAGEELCSAPLFFFSCCKIKLFLIPGPFPRSEIFRYKLLPVAPAFRYKGKSEPPPGNKTTLEMAWHAFRGLILPGSYAASVKELLGHALV